MGKRIAILIRVIICIVFLFSIYNVSAAEDDTNNLTLDTEILNNKKEEVNSNTTIEDVNLFSSDYQATLDNENQNNNKYYHDISSSVFTTSLGIDNTTKEDIKIFESKVTFDKNLIEVTKTFDFMPIFIAAVLLLMIITYVLTRRKYTKKSKEEENSANYSNIYEGYR